MKKILVTVLCLIALLTLVACDKGGESENNKTDAPVKNVAVADIMKACEAKVSTTDWIEIKMEDIESYFTDINKDDVAEISAKYLDIYMADEIIIIKAKDGKADAIYNGLKSYWESRKSAFDGYLPNEFARIDAESKIVLKKSGNYVIYSVTEKNADIEAAFTNALK